MTRERFLSRREVMRIGGMSLLCSPLAALAGCGAPASRTYTEPQRTNNFSTKFSALRSVFSGMKRARTRAR